MPLLPPDKKTQKLMNEYTKYYEFYLDDSHPSQRAVIIERINKLTEILKNYPLRVLDIGSGPQLLEKELFEKHPQLKGRISIITLDIASIQPDKLQAKLPHIQADAVNLPFESNSFDLIVSNMALDLIAPKGNERRKQLFSEIHRVLKPHGKLIATLHNPSLELDYFVYDKNKGELTDERRELSEELQNTQDEQKKIQLETSIEKNKIAMRDVHFRYWEIHKYVFRSVEEISDFFVYLPFQVVKIEEQQDEESGEKWFYIELENSENATIN